METLELKFKKLGTVQLLLKVDKLEGEEKIICFNVLKSRGQDVSKWESKVPTSSLGPKIYEIEPEQELTSIEKKLLKDFKEAPLLEIEKTKSIDVKVSKSQSIRNLSDTGLTVKQIQKETGFDYTLIYDVIKAYEKKKIIA